MSVWLSRVQGAPPSTINGFRLIAGAAGATHLVSGNAAPATELAAMMDRLAARRLAPRRKLVQT